jgi:hypothetical protein
MVFSGCLGQSATTSIKTYSNNAFSFDYPSTWDINEEIDPRLSSVEVHTCRDKKCAEGIAFMVMWFDHEVNLSESIRLLSESQQFGYTDSYNVKNPKIEGYVETNFKGNRAFIQNRTATIEERQKGDNIEGITIIFNCGGKHYILLFDKSVSEKKPFNDFEMIQSFKCN